PFRNDVLRDIVAGAAFIAGERERPHERTDRAAVVQDPRALFDAGAFERIESIAVEALVATGVPVQIAHQLPGHTVTEQRVVRLVTVQLVQFGFARHRIDEAMRASEALTDGVRTRLIPDSAGGAGADGTLGVHFHAATLTHRRRPCEAQLFLTTRTTGCTCSP